MIITDVTPASKVVPTDESVRAGILKSSRCSPHVLLPTIALAYSLPCQDTPSGSSSRSIAVGPRPKRARATFDSVAVPVRPPGAAPSLPASDGLGLSSVVRPTGIVLSPSLLEPLPSRWSSTGYSPSYRPPSFGLLGVSPVALALLHTVPRVASSTRILSLPCSSAVRLFLRPSLMPVRRCQPPCLLPQGSDRLCQCMLLAFALSPPFSLPACLRLSPAR